jgi:hypothetical protein
LESNRGQDWILARDGFSAFDPKRASGRQAILKHYNSDYVFLRNQKLSCC